MKKLILLIILLFSVNAHGVERDWLGLDKKDNHWFYTGTVLLIMDAAQTHDIKRHEGAYEINPILGEYPSNTKINIYFTAWGLFNYGFNRWGSKIMKDVWNTGLITVQLNTVTGNYLAGFKMEF